MTSMYANEINGKHKNPFLKIWSGAKYSVGGIAENRIFALNRRSIVKWCQLTWQDCDLLQAIQVIRLLRQRWLVFVRTYWSRWSRRRLERFMECHLLGFGFIAQSLVKKLRVKRDEWQDRCANRLHWRSKEENPLFNQQELEENQNFVSPSEMSFEFHSLTLQTNQILQNDQLAQTCFDVKIIDEITAVGDESWVIGGVLDPQR